MESEENNPSGLRQEKQSESRLEWITHERLAVINKLKKVKAAINIIDLKNEANVPQGVRVELLLPLELAF